MRSRQVFIITFGREEDILAAVRASRERGFDILDTYTPYAVHGLDDAMGLPQSKLPWFTFAFGLTGAALMLWFQFWASWFNWPINIGGKPWNSLPAFVPAKFEIVILFAGVGTFLSFLAIRRLFPGRKPFLPVPGVTDDLFALMLGEKGATLDVAEIRGFFKAFNAVNTESLLVESAAPRAGGWKILNASLFLLLVLSVVCNLLMLQNRAKPNYQFISNMAYSIPYDSFAPNPNTPDGKTLQPPAPGTIVRGGMPLRFGTTPEEAVRAGVELKNPFKPDDAAAAARGAEVFGTFCLPCHGAGGTGNGAVAKRGYPPPPSMLTGEPVKIEDGEIFHTITYGRGNMPPHAAQIAPEDRWKAILHVRAIQKQAAEEAVAKKAGEEAMKPAAVSEKTSSGNALKEKASEKKQ